MQIGGKKKTGEKEKKNPANILNEKVAFTCGEQVTLNRGTPTYLRE